jgi:hypothetical protein
MGLPSAAGDYAGLLSTPGDKTGGGGDGVIKVDLLNQCCVVCHSWEPKTKNKGNCPVKLVYTSPCTWCSSFVPVAKKVLSERRKMFPTKEASR